jgi:hypothetical protein
MFIPVPTPPEPDGTLGALRLSLNAPVLGIDALPVGPASAAIALHVSADAPRITIALRSARSGERVFFASDASGDREPGLLLDAALAFAERMGFLFDDDEVESRGESGPREAARIWREFAGLADAGEPPPPPAPGAPAGSLPLTKFRSGANGAAVRRADDLRIQLLGRF